MAEPWVSASRPAKGPTCTTCAGRGSPTKQQLAAQRDKLIAEANEKQRELSSLGGQSGAGCMRSDRQARCDQLQREIPALRDRAYQLNVQVGRMNDQDFAPKPPPEAPPPPPPPGGLKGAIERGKSAVQGIGATVQGGIKAGQDRVAKEILEFHEEKRVLQDKMMERRINGPDK